MSAIPFVIKALDGGLIVSAVALLGDVAQPKRFAGIFSAAPTVAVASLTVVAVTIGTTNFADYGRGMLLGSIAFAVFALVGQPLIVRLGSFRGSALALVSWFAVALPLLWIVGR